MRHFLMQHIHQFYKQQGPTLPANASLLEFGGGPVIAYVISSEPFVSSVVFSDYCEGGRAAVDKWRQNLADAHDWTPFFEYVVKELEDNQTPEEPTRRAERLRQKIVNVLPCDATKVQPIGPGYDRTFHVISVSFCFESACTSHHQVVTALKGLAQMLVPGGWIRINGVYRGSYYRVDREEFFNLTQTEETLRRSLQESGFECKSFDLFLLEQAAKNADYKGIYHASAQLY